MIIEKKVCHKSLKECGESDPDDCHKFMCNYDMNWLKEIYAAYDKGFSIYSKSMVELSMFKILEYIKTYE